MINLRYHRLYWLEVADDGHYQDETLLLMFHVTHTSSLLVPRLSDGTRVGLHAFFIVASSLPLNADDTMARIDDHVFERHHFIEVRAEDLPCYIHLPHKMPIFDRIMKGEESIF